MYSLVNKRGLTVIEIIMTLAVMGVVICPLMNMFTTSRRIINFSHHEYKSIQTAQMYMEEIKAMEELNTDIYIFNGETGCFERYVSETDNNYGAEIQIIPNGIICYINIDIISDGEIINSLAGSKIFQ